MNDYKEKMAEWNEEYAQMLASAKRDANSAIDVHVDNFRKNSMGSITRQFGEFLYTVMGERVTGQRSSTLNTVFLEETTKGMELVKNAEENGNTIEEESKARQKAYWDRYGHRVNSYERNNEPDIYITVGRKFGVSHFTGKGNRVHTRYFNIDECFTMLTQLHVDCIKNRQKRECAQDFLKYRNAFVDEAKTLNHILAPTNVQAKMIQPATIAVYNGASRYDSKTFNVIEDEYSIDVTHTMAMIQNYPVWDMKSSSVSSGRPETFISLVFLNIGDGEDNDIKVLGNVDMSMKDLRHSLKNDGATNRIDHVSCFSHDTIYDGYPAIKNSEFRDRNVKFSNHLIVNLDEVIADPTINKLMEERIDFYNRMSSDLQELKHNHATLYFLHGDI